MGVSKLAQKTVLRYFSLAKVWINVAHKFLTSKYSALILKIPTHKLEFRKREYIRPKREKVLNRQSLS